MADQPDRAVIDNPKAMRALAHPRRLEILALLRDSGPMTVTELARSTEDSTASVSYHLQQLSSYGFIERATELDRGREKRWRARHVSYSFETSSRTEFSRAAALSLRWAMADQTHQIVNDYITHAGALPQEWQEAAIISESGLYVTASELRKITIEMLKVLDPYRDRTIDRASPDARYSHIIVYGIPSATELHAITRNRTRQRRPLCS